MMKFTDLEYEDIKSVATLKYDWDKLNNKVLLISGGTGFLGTFIANVCKYRNENFSSNIKIISLSRRGGIDNDTIQHRKIDINNKFEINEKIDYILHLASNTHPQQYKEDPIGTITTNIFGCDNLLKIAMQNPNCRFLLASSVEVYGEGTNAPMDEEYSGYINPNLARSGYNESKRVCESLCQAYREKNNIDYVGVRLARIFGADSKKDTKAMSQFMENALMKQNIVLKSKGLQRFSYCYIADAASAIFKVILDGRTGQVYNVSDDDEGKTLGEYAEYISSLCDMKVIYDIKEDESVSKSTYALLNCEKLKLLGWTPQYTVSDSLGRTFDIKKQHLNS